MNAPPPNNIFALQRGNHQCLSCGTSNLVPRKRYCSKECRQQLFRRLRILAGLLRALSTNYATFSFNDSSLILDVKPRGSNRVYRFLYQRSQRKKPSQDLYQMTDELGSAWWDNKKRTGKRYQASQQVLKMASKKNIPPASVLPIEIKKPARIGMFLSTLNLDHKDLKSQHASKTVKSAYRKKAFQHHPDRGGNSAAFRKINVAYQAIIAWLKSPALRIQKGLPGKWCFDGKTWRTPLPFAVPYKAETGKTRT